MEREYIKNLKIELDNLNKERKLVLDKVKSYKNKMILTPIILSSSILTIPMIATNNFKVDEQVILDGWEKIVNNGIQLDRLLQIAIPYIIAVTIPFIAGYRFNKKHFNGIDLQVSELKEEIDLEQNKNEKTNEESKETIKERLIKLRRELSICYDCGYDKEKYKKYYQKGILRKKLLEIYPEKMAIEIEEKVKKYIKI